MSYLRGEDMCKMGKKLDKVVSDRVEYVAYNIIIGISFWIISSVVVTYQQNLIKHIRNILLSYLFYVIPMLVLVWFISISRKKNQWKPFGSNSNIIGIIIILSVSVILFSILGILKVII